MTGGPVLAVRGLSKRFGGFAALSEVGLEVAPAERLGIIGPNGSGKTTLIHCICGALRPDAGSVTFLGTEVTRMPAHARARRGLARSFQIPRPFGSLTLVQNVAVPLEYVAHRGSLHVADVEAEALALLRRMGLGARAADRADALSQVDLRRLELARAVATRPRLLILDEVMAGLSAAEVDEILGIVLALNAEGVAVVMIEHIMRAIMRFSQRVLCLDAGRVVAQGAPEAVVADPTVRRIYLGA